MKYYCTVIRGETVWPFDDRGRLAVVNEYVVIILLILLTRK